MKNFTLMILTLALCVIGSSNVIAQMITVTSIGTGVTGFNGDGLSAALTQINSPYDVSVDAAHNIYFTDQANGRIRMQSAATGTITTIGGGGTSTAEGVSALTALVNPYYMCIDAAGNVYFSTIGAIRKISAAGIITTVAGTGSAGYSGDGGLATAAMIQGQLGICVDAAGNIYFADGANNRIRKITAATGIITTIAGTGTAGYTGDGSAATSATISCPTVICIDHSGNLFFADQAAVTGGIPYYGSTSNFIREINAGTGVITTIAGTPTWTALFDCAADSAYLGWITGMCCDDSGNVIFNEISCSCRKICMSTGYMLPVAGNFSIESYDGDGGASLGMWMDNPYGLCADPAGNVYIADNMNDRIRKLIQVTNTPTFAFGRGQSFTLCQGTNVDLAGQLTFTDMDLLQTETFTVLSAPTHGTLTGFPYAMLSTGQDTVAIPTGLSYTANTNYSGTDVFKIIVSDGTNSDTATLYAVVHGAPAVIGGLNQVCIGSVITLTDDSTGTWSVSNDNASITPGAGSVTVNALIAGTDTIMYTNSNACGTGTVSQIVAVQAIPDPGTISGTSSVNTGASITVSDPATGGTWSSAENTIATVSATGIVYGISAGTDNIIYTITNSCGSFSTTFAITVKVAPNAVANVTAASDNLLVSPNPARSQFSINVTSSFDEPVIIIITNIAGEQVQQITATTNNTINTALHVPAGIYLIQAATAHGNMNSKIVIQ